MATKIGTAYVDVKGDFTQLHQGVATALAPAQMGKFGKAGGIAAGAAMGGAVAAALGGAVVTKALYDLGAEFDRAFDKIRTGTGKTGKPLKQLEKDFKAVFASVPTDVDNAADAITNLSKRLDISGKPLRALSKNMLELSRMTETDLQGNIQSVSRLFGDWSVATGKQVPTLNKLWRASQETGVGIKDLSDLMVQFGSPLRNLGFDFDTAAAMFSKFEKEGVNIQTAMPGLRMALKNFAADGKDPQKALLATFKAIDKAGSAAKANTIAFDTFGTRAGPDLAAAVREGRFEFDDIIKSMTKGKDTVMKSSRDTRDFGENMNILGNKLKVAFQPLGTVVFGAVGNLSKVLAALPIRRVVADVRRFVKTNQDFKDVLKAVGVGLRAFGAVAKFVFGIMKEQFKAAWQYVKGGLLMLKGLIKVVSGVLTGDFGKAWSGVKTIFRGGVKLVLGVIRGMTAPLRAVLKPVARLLGSLFKSAWGKVEGIFEAGGNAIIGVINKIIDAINLIPGVDIGEVGYIGGSESGDLSGGGKKVFTGRQRGGDIRGGKPSGDSVPALLERGEYVLNREAVKRVGVDKLDHLNFKKARRFQTGGPIGMISGGGVLGGLKDIGAAALGNTPGGKLLANKGADFFIDKLPSPDLPDPFGETGPWMIEKVANWIKGHVEKKQPKGGSYSADGNVVKIFADTLRRFNANKTVALALFEAGLAESGMRDLSYGDSTSQGALQLLASTAAGSGVDPHNEGQIASSFLTDGYGMGIGAIGYNKQDPSMPAHMIAQSVQRSAFSDGSNYLAQKSAALRLLAQNGFAKGGLVGMLRGGMAGRKGQSQVPDPGGRPGSPPVAARGIGDSKGPPGWSGTAPRTLNRLFAIANYVSRKHLPYVWGGGHASTPAQLGSGVDCSGATSYLVQQAGWNLPTAVSGTQAGWFSGGRNDDFTIMANPEHVYAVIGGRAWGTSDENPGGGAGWINGYTYRGGFSERTTDLGSGGGSGSGSSGPSAAQIAAAKRKKLMGDRTKKIKDLRAAVGDAKGPLQRKGALWKLLKGYAQFGELDKDDKRSMITTVREAMSAVNPLGGVNALQGLASGLKKTDITGGAVNDDFLQRLTDVKEAASKRGKSKRARKLTKIGSRGINYPLKGSLAQNEAFLARLGEQIEVAESWSALESSPDGSELSTNEWLEQRELYGHKLFPAQSERIGYLQRSIQHVSGVAKKNEWMVDLLEGRLPKVAKKLGGKNPKRWLASQQWKLPGYRKAIRNAKSTLKNNLNPALSEMVGVTGRGGELFQTKLKLQELGIDSPVLTRDKEEGDDEKTAAMLDIMREQLGVANRKSAILLAQMPIFEQFMPKYHTGGVIPGAGEKPIMAKGGEGVFTADQMAAMGGGGSPTVVIEIAPGAGVDPAMIDARINGVLVNTVRKVRTGGPTVGRKAVTSG